MNNLENYKKKWSKQKTNMEKNFYLLSKKKYKIAILRIYINKKLDPLCE